MQYFENLPDQCPPCRASDASFDSALRFVSSVDPKKLTIDDFKSYAALGQRRPNTDPCELASCSFFKDSGCKGFKAARKLPKLRQKPVARLSIPQGSGKSTVNEKGHIHFWMYVSFDPLTHIQEVIEYDAA